MESLTGPSLKGVCLNKLVDKHRGLCLCYKDVGLSKRSEICFLGLSSSKLFHRNLISSVQHKTIQHTSSAAAALQSSSDTQTQTPIEEAESMDTNSSIHVRVKFQLPKECSFGQHFLIVGDDPVLGSWNPSNAVPLEWSEGHIWVVELDIPSGKSVCYKFILKKDAKTILWQEGPDRVLQTWETKNMISVTEDWDNAELQNIVEEELVAEQSEDSAVNPETLVADNLVPPVLGIEGDVNKEKTESANENLAIVAENITEAKEEVNPDEGSGGAFYLNDSTMEAKTIANTGMAFNGEVVSSKDEATPFVDEKVPVLVPGLTQALTSEAEEVLLDQVDMDNAVVEGSDGSKTEEPNVLFDNVNMDKVVGEGSLGSKTEELNMPELNPNDESATDLLHSDKTSGMILSLKQEVCENEGIEKSELVEGGDWSNGKPLEEEGAFESDIQWGKRALHKFFTNLGFFKVELEG